jgi:hypothetical protein
MDKFNDLAEDLSDMGWEVEYSSATATSNGETAFYGHLITLSRVLRDHSAHEEHVQMEEVFVRRWEDMYPALKNLFETVQRGDRAPTVEDYEKLELLAFVDADLTEVTDELNIHDVMMHAGWQYHISIEPKHPHGVQKAKHLRYFRHDWHGTVHKDGMMLRRMNYPYHGSFAVNWDKSAKLLAEQAVQYWSENPEKPPIVALPM